MTAGVITPAMLTQEMLRLSKLLDQAHDELVAASHTAAEKEAEYRLLRAKAFTRASGKTVGDREAQALLQCGPEMQAAHLAESLKVAALERVRSIRAQLSACQSVATAVRSEVEMAGRYAS